MPLLRVGEVSSSLRQGRFRVSLIVMALLFCRGAFGYAHQLPPAGVVQTAHVTHAAGVHQPGQDRAADGLHLQDAYFATLILLLFGASLLPGGGASTGAKLPAPALRTYNRAWRPHPP